MRYYIRSLWSDTNPFCQWRAALRGGAVAYIGCATGSQTCAWRLMEGFIWAYTSRFEPRLGGIWESAVTHYHRVWNLDGIEAHEWWQVAVFDPGMTFPLFGDPPPCSSPAQ